MNTYRKGVRLERLARAELERQGYSVTPAPTCGVCRCGVRSAGSKGAVNLAAFSQARILLVQVKACRITQADRSRLANFPAPPGAVRQFWRWINGTWAITTSPAPSNGACQTDQIALLLSHKETDPP